MNDVSNPQLGDIYKAIVHLSSETGEIKGHVEAAIVHLERINGTLDSHAGDIQALKTADEINKASTIRFRWFFGIMIPVVAAIAVAFFKSGIL